MKCHSKRLDSKGTAHRVASGLLRSSVASLRMRLIVGDLELKVGRDIAVAMNKNHQMEYYELGFLVLRVSGAVVKMWSNGYDRRYCHNQNDTYRFMRCCQSGYC